MGRELDCRTRLCVFQLATRLRQDPSAEDETRSGNWRHAIQGAYGLCSEAAQPITPRWHPRLELRSSCRTRSKGCGRPWVFERIRGCLYRLFKDPFRILSDGCQLITVV